jgi:hypothetical protein
VQAKNYLPPSAATQLSWCVWHPRTGVLYYGACLLSRTLLSPACTAAPISTCSCVSSQNISTLTNVSLGMRVLDKGWLLPAKRFFLHNRMVLKLFPTPIFFRLFASGSIGDFQVTKLSFFHSFSFDSCQLVEDIGIHVHVFAGSLDELCSPSTSALLADSFKLGTLHLVRGVGHISSMMECWQVWCLFFEFLFLFKTF